MELPNQETYTEKRRQELRAHESRVFATKYGHFWPALGTSLRYRLKSGTALLTTLGAAHKAPFDR